MASKPIEQVKQEALAFLQERMGFAQVHTVNEAGYPAGRTMGASINDDWTLDMIGPKGARRIDHVRNNGKVEVVWVDNSTRIPKAVFLQGTGTVFEGDELVERYNRRMDINEARGRGRGPRQAPDVVRETLLGIHVKPVRVRVEGFGEGTEIFSWKA
jgi:general stress protein 26